MEKSRSRAEARVSKGSSPTSSGSERCLRPNHPPPACLNGRLGVSPQPRPSAPGFQRIAAQSQGSAGGTPKDRGKGQRLAAGRVVSHVLQNTGRS